MRVDLHLCCSSFDLVSVVVVQQAIVLAFETRLKLIGC